MGLTICTDAGTIPVSLTRKDKGMDITKKQARQLIAKHWGQNPGPKLPAELYAAFESAISFKKQMQGYSILDWLQAIAGDDYDWRSQPNWEARSNYFRNLF